MHDRDIERQFLEAYDAYSDAIYRYCYFRIFDRERAKDFMQETFMRTWEYISKGEKVDNVRAFLYRVANNLIVDDSRKKKEASLEKMQEDGFDPGRDETPSMQARIDEKRILSLLHEIDDPYREAVILRYIEELKPAEIAEIVGESSNVVSVRIHRGLRHLRVLLTNKHQDHSF